MSACTDAVAAPSRSLSAAKSPPTSSACRSPSAYRSRTLAVASRQPSLALGTNVCSIATVAAGTAGSGSSISMWPSSGAMCGFFVVGIEPRLEPPEELEDRLGPVDQGGVALLARDDVAGQALRDVGDAGGVE